MQITRMIVTPEMASAWLADANTNNRSLSLSTVSRYAHDMSAGNWVETHQNAIGFYETGLLADGQHRLAAVVKSGASVPMYVAFGLSADAVNAIDQGRPRRMQDVLALSGVLPSGKYASLTVAMMNVIRAAELKQNRIATAHEIKMAVERMADGIQYSNNVMTRSSGRMMSAPLRAAIAVAYYRCNIEKLSAFADILCTGMPLKDGDVTVITLRNRILTGTPATGGTNRINAYKMALRFIRAYDQGRVLTMAKSSDELVFKTGIFNV